MPRTSSTARSSAAVVRSGLWNSSPWQAQTSSVAITWAAYPTTVRALSAASAPIELKSSVPAEVGMEPAPAGWEST